MVFKFKILFLSFVVIALFSFVNFSVFAEENESEDVDDSSEVSTTVSPTKAPRNVKAKEKIELNKERIEKAKERNKEIKENIKERNEERKEKKEEKLSEQRLKICEQRSENIEKRIKNVSNKGSKNHKRFSEIYTKVDKFYNDKLVPNGYILSNYADLKAEVSANEENVKALLTSATSIGTDFDCSSEDPKTQLSDFTEDMKALVVAEKEYRESIRNFIKAVRDLAKQAKSERLSVTPTVSEEEGE